MTLQLKGICWSMGIHGTFFLIFILLQFFILVRDKQITVIDFTFSEDSALPVNEPSSSQAATRSMVSHPKPQIKAQENIARIAQTTSFQEETPQEAAEQSPSPVWPKNEANKQMSTTADNPPQAGISREGFTAAGPPPLLEGKTVASGALEQNPEQSRTAYLKEHFVYIRTRILNGILYPEMARRIGWQGRVKIAFIICEDGNVINARVIESCGFAILDNNAVATVKTVAPFPRPPAKAEIRMAVTYRLN